MSDAPFDLERYDSVRRMERLSETLRDRPAGDLFAADLDEARLLAKQDPRFDSLVAGLQANTLGERLDAISAFFEGFSAAELATLQLPPNLNQLRLIYVSSGEMTA